MNYEVIKSYLLVILIAISVLLSVALWTYQPNYEQFQDPDYVSEVDIGGEEQEKKDLISPSSIIFHDNQRVLSFNDPTEERTLYESMNTWVMHDVEEREISGRPKDRRFIEIIYPTAIPGKTIPDLFTFNDEINPPDWSFDRIFMTFNQDDLSLNINFVSTDENKELIATVEKHDKYDLLLDYVVNHPNLIDYTDFRSEEKQFYIPGEEMDLASKTLVISKIQPEKLVNALFRDPSRVTPNVAEAYFTDGQRGMNVSNNNNKIEFINPIQTSPDTPQVFDLLERSIANINGHKGWTNDYVLESISSGQSKVKFRLMYDELPVFERNDLTLIEQKWRAQELYEYNRSLIRLTHEVNSVPKSLPSGEKLINYLENGNGFELNKIDDIRIGYELKFLSNASDSMLLEPTWYVKYQAKWRPIDTDELTTEGGE